jgi:kinesin family protein 13
MEKSWEQKLAESKQKEQEEEAALEAEKQARLMGTPHLMNLNEDPMLDRKVTYDIAGGSPLTCGRRNKKASHRLQLGGVGVEPEHCAFELMEDGNVKLTALSDKSLKNVKVNGEALIAMSGKILLPNDRVCIGPSAIFIFKNKSKETPDTKPDTDDDPITYEDAEEEVMNIENAMENEIAKK